MGEEWYYAHDGNQGGPIPFSELKRSAAAGELLASDLVWRDGMAEWVPAKQVRELYLDEQVKTRPVSKAQSSVPVQTIRGAAKEVEWYYAAGDLKQGPVSILELRRLAAEGAIQPTDLVWSEGQDEWVQASQVHGLFALTSTESMPPADFPASRSVRRISAKLAELRYRLRAFWAKLNQKQKKQARVGGVVVAVVLLIGILDFAFRTGGKGGSGGDGIDSITFTASQMAQEYRADKAIAETKFKGKQVAISGVVDKPAGEFSKNEIQLETSTERFALPMIVLVCRFGAKYEQEVFRFQRGDEVRLKGECVGINPHSDPNGIIVIEFEKCELLSFTGSRSTTSIVPNGNRTETRVSRAIVQSRLRLGMSPGEVRNILGEPDDEKTTHIDAVYSQGRQMTPAIDVLSFMYLNTPDGMLGVAFRNGKLNAAQSEKGGLIFGQR